MGPFSTPPFQIFKSRRSALFPKNILTNSERYFIYPTISLGPLASINYFIEKDDFSLQYITIDNAIAAIQNFGQGCYMGKTHIESAFPLIPAYPANWELLGMF